MAKIKAQATGVWSAGGTWSGGVAPGVGDVGYSNGFTVTIDQDITCTAISNASDTGITAGGQFVVSAGPRILNCDLSGQPPGFTGTSSTTLLLISVAGTVTINGNIISGTTTQNYLDMSTAGATVNLNGNISTASSTGGPSPTYVRLNAANLTFNMVGSALGVANNGTHIAWASGTGCVINITGDISPNSGGSGAGIVLGATAVTVSITGNITSTSSNVALNASSGAHTITLVGNATSGGAIALQASGGITLDISGTVTASSTAAAVDSSATTAVHRVRGALITGANNKQPMFVRQLSVKAGQNLAWTLKDDSATPTGANVTLTNYVANSPAPANVRAGVLYGPSGDVLGTLAVPPKGAVLLGVATDDGVGQAAISVDPMLAPL